jgi:hypothetical protein
VLVHLGQGRLPTLPLVFFVADLFLALVKGRIKGWFCQVVWSLRPCLRSAYLAQWSFTSPFWFELALVLWYAPVWGLVFDYCNNRWLRAFERINQNERTTGCGHSNKKIRMKEPLAPGIWKKIENQRSTGTRYLRKIEGKNRRFSLFQKSQRSAGFRETPGSFLGGYLTSIFCENHSYIYIYLTPGILIFMITEVIYQNQVFWYFW